MLKLKFPRPSDRKTLPALRELRYAHLMFYYCLERDISQLATAVSAPQSVALWSEYHSPQMYPWGPPWVVMKLPVCLLNLVVDCREAVLESSTGGFPRVRHLLHPLSHEAYS